MEIKYYQTCEYCNYKALDRSKWIKHINSQKHKRGGKTKIENNICEICGYWSVHTGNFQVHKICAHGTVEQKKQAPFYCKCCNKAYYSDLFYQNHLKSKKHNDEIKLIIKKIDNQLIDKYYMKYINKLEKQLHLNSLLN